MDVVSISSSSDETSDEENNLPAIADLLWHKVRKTTRTDSHSQSHPVTEPQISSQPSPSTSKTEPQVQHQLARTKQFQVEIGNLLAMNTKRGPEARNKSDALMKSKGKQNTSSGLSVLIHSRMDKDLKKIVLSTKPSISEGQKKKSAKLEKSRWSLGKEGWGSMRMTEMTEQKKQDLMVLNMRSTINPTRHYKHGDVKTPKFFQIGTVEEDHYGFYHDRVPMKKRKRTLVDELMADQEFKGKLKKKYDEVISTKTRGNAVFQRKAPRKIKRKK